MKVKVPSYNKTLCVLANTKVGDLYGHKIVSCLKNDFNLQDIQVIGNGGEYLKKHGQRSIFDLNDLREKFLYLWRYSTKNIHSLKHYDSNLYQVCLRMNNNIINLVGYNIVIK